LRQSLRASHYTQKENRPAQQEREATRHDTRRETARKKTITNRQREETDTIAIIKKKKKKIIIKKLLTNVGCHVIIELAPFCGTGVLVKLLTIYLIHLLEQKITDPKSYARSPALVKNLTNRYVIPVLEVRPLLKK